MILNDKAIPQLIKIEGESTIPSIITLGGSATYDNDDEHSDDEEHNIFTYRNVKRVIGMGTLSAACSSEVVPHLAIQSASQRRKGLVMNKLNKKEGLGSMKLEHMMTEARENPAMLRLPNGYVMDAVGSDENDNKHDDVEDDEDEEEGGDNFASPEYISSKILKTLFETAEETTGEKITRAVIGVPAYFNDMQREATIKVNTNKYTHIYIIYTCDIF